MGIDSGTRGVERELTLRYEQPVGTTIGGFAVGHHAKMNGNPNAGTIVGVKEENGRVRVTVQFPEPQPLDGPEGATSVRFEMDWRNVTSTWAPILTHEQIAEALATQDEAFDESHVGHYLSIEELAEKVRSQKNWAMGEVFCCAVDPEKFLILKQIAPSSCEMLTISQNGFHDVLTAYRYSQDELVAQLSAYAGLEKPVSDKSATPSPPDGNEIPQSEQARIGRFEVTLASVGNPDHGQNPDAILPGVASCRCAVSSLKEASAKCREFIDEHGLGGGNWSGGEVFEDGVLVARVSYNGRVWRAGEEPVAAATAVADVSADEADPDDEDAYRCRP